MIRQGVRIAIVLVVVSACATFKSGPPPAQLAPTDVQLAQTRFPAATADTLESGRQTFVASCQKCHKLPLISAWTEPQWQRILPEMAGKAQLDPVRTEQTLQFILTAHASINNSAAQ